MQSYLLKNITVADRHSPFNGQTGDLAIIDGKISDFGQAIDEQQFEKVYDFSECLITSSFVDLRCNSTEPGYEHRDTFESLNKTALAGGFSHLCLLPNSNPPRNTKSDIEFVMNQVNKFPVRFLPLGTITHNMQSDDLSEMYDMKKSGAIAFSNSNNPIENSGTMSKALLYSKNFNGLIYSYCVSKQLSKGAYVSEGTIALSLGLKGIPQHAEYLMVQREIELADYHQHRVHISKISTERSVELIRQAKLQGIKVTCDVAVMNLALTDEAISDFDSNLKLTPPLRHANDVRALWEGLYDGTIDAICTDHHPLEIEKKALEFEYASFGAITLQMALGIAIEGRNRFFPQMSDEQLFEKLNFNPSNLLNIELPCIDVNQEASFVIINPHKQTIIDRKNNQSLSWNSYYLNKPLSYFIEGTCIKNQIYFNKQ
jgi:dihydroorotase